MLVLFNTAYRPGYLQNVLRTFFLPVGASNVFRYSIGDDLQASTELVKTLEGMGNARVLICFGDRFSQGGYTFHPFRRGTLEKIESAGGKVYFTVRLGAHVSCNSTTDFTQKLYGLAASNTGDDRLLALTSNDPLCSKDGRYAFWCNDNDIETLLEINEHSWRAAAGEMSKTQAFKSDDKKQFVFAKCELYLKGVMKNYVVGDHPSRYEMERDDDARLSISYFYPSQDADRKSIAKLAVLVPAGAQLLAPAELPLDMLENRLEVPFAIEPKSDKNFFSIDVRFSSDSPEVQLFGAKEALSLKVHETVWRQIAALLMVILYIVGAVVGSSGEVAVGEVMKGIALVVIFFILGKKIV